MVASRNAALSYFAVYLATWYGVSSSSRLPADIIILLSGIYPIIREYRSTTILRLVSNDANVVISKHCVSLLKMLSSILEDSHDSLFSAWVSNNVEGSYKRSVTLAMVISLCVS